jgi:acyl dehydratase
MSDTNSSAGSRSLPKIGTVGTAVIERIQNLSLSGATTDDSTETTNGARRPDPGASRPGWETEKAIDDGDSLTVGDAVCFTKTIDEGDVQTFADASGDTNPVHLDPDSETQFDERIAHGLLVSGVISAALARIPGTIIYLSQSLTFQSPVYLGDRVTAEVEILEAFGDDQYRLQTTVETADETVIDGEAVVMVES